MKAFQETIDLTTYRVGHFLDTNEFNVLSFRFFGNRDVLSVRFQVVHNVDTKILNLENNEKFKNMLRQTDKQYLYFDYF